MYTTSVGRQIVWRSSDLDIVCTLARRVTRSPAVYEVTLIVNGDVISAREFDHRQEATAEADRLRHQFVDADGARPFRNDQLRAHRNRLPSVRTPQMLVPALHEKSGPPKNERRCPTCDVLMRITAFGSTSVTYVCPECGGTLPAPSKTPQH